MFISESCISGEFDLDARMKGDQKALHCAVTMTADQWSKADSSLSPSLILRGGEQRFLTGIPHVLCHIIHSVFCLKNKIC